MAGWPFTLDVVSALVVAHDVVPTIYQSLSWLSVLVILSTAPVAALGVVQASVVVMAGGSLTLDVVSALVVALDVVQALHSEPLMSFKLQSLSWTAWQVWAIHTRRRSSFSCSA